MELYITFKTVVLGRMELYITTKTVVFSQMENYNAIKTKVWDNSVKPGFHRPELSLPNRIIRPSMSQISLVALLLLCSTV